MINLLPNQEKKKFLEERIVKQVIILEIVVFSALICLGLILFFIKLDLQGDLVFQKEILECRNKDCQSSGIIEFEKETTHLSKIFEEITSHYQKKEYLIEDIEMLSETIPENIVLINVFFKENSREFSLSGFSPDRESLLQFKDNLEKMEDFEKIYFPSSNWINPKDINFLASFRIK